MTLADGLVQQMIPWLSYDHETYLRALGLMFAEAEAYWSEEIDPNTGEVTKYGWEALFDPDLCPNAGLDFLAQLVGERIPKELTEAERRAYVKDHPNWRRGSRMAIVRAAQRTLTGQKTVYIHERDTGSTDDHLGVFTLPAETPDASRVQADIKSVLPADIVLNWGSQTAQTWTAASTGKATWSAMTTAYVTWDKAQYTGTLPAGWTTYTIADT